MSLPIEVLDAAFRVTQTNRDTIMTEGHKLNDDGTTSDDVRWRLWKDGEILACAESLASSCDGADFLSQEDANRTFNNNVRLTSDTTFEVTHYVFGDYWYTADLAEEFNSVSTHIHRSNARLAMTVQLLVSGLTEAQVMDLYTDIIGLEGAYSVQDYHGAPGRRLSVTTRSATSRSTTASTHALAVTRPTPNTTRGNPWASSPLQPSCPVRTRPPS